MLTKLYLGDDGEVCLWDIAQARMLAKLHTQQAPVSALAFSRDATTLAAGDLLHDFRVEVRQFIKK